MTQSPTRRFDALRRRVAALALCALGGLTGGATGGFGGCSRQLQPAAEDQSYFPLVAGARWRYRLSSPLGSLQMEVTARGEQVLPTGGEAFLMDERSVGPSLGFAEVAPVAYVVDGGYVARIEGVGYDSAGKLRNLGQSAATRILPLDPQPGHSWGQDHSLFDTPEGGGAHMGWNGDVLELTTITVPAGTFEDVIEVAIAYYDDRRPDLQPRVLYRDYYARGVGLVKSVTEDPSGEPTHTIEQVLIDYEFPVASAR